MPRTDSKTLFAPSPLPFRLTGLPERLRRALRAMRKRWMQRNARRIQAAYCGTFIGVTGSCGKTTTTLLIEKLLLATGASGVGGRNNNIGRYLVRQVAKLRRPVDFVVQEAGINGPGAMAELLDHVDIDVAVVTAVGTDHGSAFRVAKSQQADAIADEKGKLVEAVRPTGFACLNADDPRVAAMAGRTRGRVVSFGVGEGAVLRASNIEARWPGRLAFDLVVAGRSFRVQTRFVGTIMLPNILAALAVVHGMGRDLEPAIAALALVEPEPEHMSVVRHDNGRHYVVDTFKASFWSTKVLAADLANVGGDGTVFVLGEMSDMGRGHSSRYAAVGRIAAPLVDLVILTGDAASGYDKLEREGYANVLCAPTLDDLARLLRELPQRLVILKSKNGTGLEKVAVMVEGQPP